MRSAILLLVIGYAFCLTSCATAPSFEQQTRYASRAYLAAKRGYLAALVADNGQVQACYQAHPELRGEDASAACPSRIREEVRDTVLAFVTDADAALVALDASNEAGAPIAPQQIDALGSVQAASLQLTMLLSTVEVP